MPTRDDDGLEKWVLDRVVPLDRELERVLRVGLADDTVLNQLALVENTPKVHSKSTRTKINRYQC